MKMKGKVSQKVSPFGKEKVSMKRGTCVVQKDKHEMESSILRRIVVIYVWCITVGGQYQNCSNHSQKFSWLWTLFYKSEVFSPALVVLGKEDGGSNIKSSQELWFQPKIDLSLNKSNDQLYKYLFVKWFERYVRLFLK